MCFGHARTTVVGVAADAGMTHANVYRYPSTPQGIAAGSFAMTERRRAMSLVFDATHRFIHPVALRLDRDASAEPGWRRASRRCWR